MEKVVCEVCGAEMMRSHLNRHMTGNQCKTITCDICNDVIPFIRKKLHKSYHQRENRRLSSTHSHTTIPIEIPSFFLDPGYEDLYITFRKYIESYVKDFKLSREINFQLESFSNEVIAEKFRVVYNSQTESFKIGISFGYILLNRETGEVAFYKASRNNQRLFDTTYLINCANDFKCMHNRILNIDLQARVTYPNTKFVFVKTTNVVFFLTKVIGNPIGSAIELPSYLKNNKGLVSLIKSKKTGKPYSDNLCLFRALALFRGAHITALENEAKQLFRTYCNAAAVDPSEFHGISLDELEILSRVFNIGINVYYQKCDRNTELVFRTIQQDTILYLNLYDNHFSFISDFQKYSNRYRCLKCSKLFRHNGNYRQHLKSCDGGTKQIFYNGIFNLPSTIFDELERYGIHVPEEKHIYKYRITFDCEVFLTKDDTPDNTSKIEYSHKHNLASVSVCSNVPNYANPQCFISNGSPKELVIEVLKYMLCISKKSNSLLMEFYSDFLDDIEESPLNEKFKLYLQQIPVIGFNNSNYDLKVMRDYLIPALLKLDNVLFIIKKANQYNCIWTENLKFLDICNYLAPGFNYDSFLKAYGGSSNKSWFPYEWFDDLSKLSHTEFPSYEAFYSTLKSNNTLEPSANDNLVEEELEIIQRTPSRETPLLSSEKELIGRHRYDTIQEMFVANNWTMRDYLEYYNNLDTQPFIDALETFCQYYVDRGIDVFKEAISGYYFNFDITVLNLICIKNIIK